MAGRLVEISSHRAAATLTTAFELVLEAQRHEEPVSWVTLEHSTFFPPDAADMGVSLEMLAVIRLSDPHAAMRATVQLTRSGGFGLVIVDLGPADILGALNTRRALSPRAGRGAAASRSESRVTAPSARIGRQTALRDTYRSHRKKKLSTPLLTKLVGLAQKNDTAVVFLTEKPSQESSLSSLISLRVETRRSQDSPCDVELSVLKDKRRGPGRSFHEVYRAPAGLR